MKKLCAWVLALAVVTQIGDCSFNPSTGLVGLVMRVFYTGTDVPGGFFQLDVTANINPSSTLAAAGTAIQSAIASAATANGFTVAAGSTLMFSYQKL